MLCKIQYQVDLVLQLIDSALGGPMTGNQVKFYLDDKPIKALAKGEGFMILVNTGRENCRLRVEAYGYMPKEILVDYSQLDKNLPRIPLHLTPGLNYGSGIEFYTLEGRDPQITALEAVRKNGGISRIRGFEPKKKKLVIFNPHRLEFNQIFYGLINWEADCYEPFRIIQKLTESEYLIDHKLEAAFQSDDAISPVFFGTVLPGGQYLLKMRKDNSEGKYIVRYIKNKEIIFKLIDFNQTDTLFL